MTPDGVYLRRMVCVPELVVVRAGLVEDVELDTVFRVVARDWPGWAVEGWPGALADVERQVLGSVPEVDGVAVGARADAPVVAG